MPLRVIFMGTPAFAVPALAEILAQGHEVCAVYTRAPKPAGRRGLEPTPSPVQTLSERFALPVHTPATLRTAEALAAFAAHAADVAVVVAYGMILPPAILQAPRLGCLNLHGSLLPRWRGAAPIQRAAMAGDKQSGVMVMRMEDGLDTGPVGMAEHLAIGPDMTAGELHDALAPIGADLMARALAALARGSLQFTPQASEGVTYAKKIEKAEARMGWALPAQTLHNHIRGLSPFPGAWFEGDFGRGPERVKVLRSALAEGAGAPGVALDDALTIACGAGALRLVQLQRAGKGVMRADEFLRGQRAPAGMRFY